LIQRGSEKPDKAALELPNMFKITLDPIIFSIGHLQIRWYSLIILIAIPETMVVLGFVIAFLIMSLADKIVEIAPK